MILFQLGFKEVSKTEKILYLCILVGIFVIKYIYRILSENDVVLCEKCVVKCVVQTENIKYHSIVKKSMCLKCVKVHGLYLYEIRYNKYIVILC